MFSRKFLVDSVLLILFLWLGCPFAMIQTLHAETIPPPLPYSVYEALGKIEGFVAIPVSKVGEYPTIEEIESYSTGKTFTMFQNSGCTFGRPCTAFISITAAGTSTLITGSGQFSIYVNAIYMGETLANGASTAGSITLFNSSSGGCSTSTLNQLTGALQTSGSGTGTSIVLSMSGGNVMVAPASATTTNNPINLCASNSNGRAYSGWITYYLSN